MFKTGQIVEAQISFKLVPVAGKKFKMLPTLRGIAMLSMGPVDVSHPEFILLHEFLLTVMTHQRKQGDTGEHVQPGRISLKRRVMYGEEDEEVVAKRMKMSEVATEKGAAGSAS